MAEKNMWEIEDSLYEKGIVAICGVDEAGRGPLAGPVCAAAVILPKHLEIPGLDDSKNRLLPMESALPAIGRSMRSIFCRRPSSPRSVPLTS